MSVIARFSLFKLGKPNGNDGLTEEFYKAFWPLLGNLVVDCLNEALMSVVNFQLLRKWP